MKKFNRLFVSEGLVDDFLAAQEKGETLPATFAEDRTFVCRSFDLNERLAFLEEDPELIADGEAREIQAIKFNGNNLEVYFKIVDHNQEEGE